MFSLILGEHPSTAPHDGTDLGEAGAEFAPTLSAGPSDDGGRDFEPRLDTGLRDRVTGISECNATSSRSDFKSFFFKNLVFAEKLDDFHLTKSVSIRRDFSRFPS